MTEAIPCGPPVAASQSQTGTRETAAPSMADVTAAVRRSIAILVCG